METADIIKPEKPPVICLSPKVIFCFGLGYSIYTVVLRNGQNRTCFFQVFFFLTRSLETDSIVSVSCL